MGEPQPAGPSKRYRRRRLLLAVGASLLLVALGLAVLQSAPVENALRHRLVAFVAERAGAEVSIGRLELRAFRATLEVYDVEIAATDETYELRLERTTLRATPTGRLASTLVGPALLWRADRGEVSSSRPAIGSLLERLRVESAVVERAEVRLEVGPETQHLASGIAIDLLRTAPGRFEAGVSVGSGRVSVAGGLQIEASSLEVLLSEDVVQVGAANLNAAGASLVGDGAWQLLPDFEGSWVGRVDSGAELVSRLVERASGGRFRARVGLAGRQGGRMGVDLVGDVEGLVVAEVELGPLAVDASFELGDAGVTVSSARATGRAGSVDLSGDIDVAASTADLLLHWSGLDLGRLSSLVFPMAVPALQRSSGEMRLGLTPPGPDSATTVDRLRLEGRALLEADGSDSAMAASGSVAFELVEGELHARTDGLEVGPTRVVAEGALRAGELEGAYRLQIDDLLQLSDVGEAIGVRVPRTGLSGQVAVDGSLGGTLDVPRFSAVVQGDRIQARQRPLGVEARVVGRPARLEIESLEVHSEAAVLSVTGQVPLREAAKWSLEGRLSELDLCTLLPFRIRSWCPQASGAGNVSGARSAPRWSFEGVLLSESGDTRLQLAARGDTSAVDRLTLRGRLFGGELESSGGLSFREGQVQGRLTASGLQLSWLVPGSQESRLLGLLEAQVTLGGTVERPVGQAVVEISELALNDVPLPSLSVQAEADGESVVLTSSAAGRLLLEGRLEVAAPRAFDLDLDLASVPWNELALALPATRDLLTELSATGRAWLQGRAVGDPELRWGIEAERVQASVLGEAATVGPIRLEGDALEIGVVDVRVRSRRSDLRIEGRVGLAEPASFIGQLAGRLDLSLIAVPDLEAEGILELDAAVDGALREPRLQGRLEMQGVSGSWRSAAWTDLELLASLDGDRVTVRDLGFSTLGGSVEAEGEVSLVRDDAMARVLVFRAEGLDLMQLAADVEADLSVEVDLGGSVRGWIGDLESLSGGGSLASLRATVGDRVIESHQAAAWTLGDGRLVLSPLSVSGEGVELEVSGDVDLIESLPSRLRVKGDGSLELLPAFLSSDAGVSAQGRSGIDLTWTHGAAGSSLNGTVEVLDGRFVSRTPRLDVDEVEARLLFEGLQITVEELRGRIGDGDFEGGGFVRLSDQPLMEEVDLTLTADGVSLEVSEGATVRLRGDLGFRGDSDDWVLEGELRLLQGLYERDFEFSSAETQVLADLRRARAELVRDSFRNRVRLDIGLETSGVFQLDNEIAQGGLGGSLRIGGTLLLPEITGSASMTEGSFQLGRNVFELERGTVEFDGYPRRTAALDAAVTTSVSDTFIRVELAGPLDDLRVRMNAPDEPQMTETDITSLLVTGRTNSDGSSGAASAVGAQAAVYLGDLFQEQSGLGLVFDVAGDIPVLNNDREPQNLVSVGREITDNLKVAYAFSLEDSGAEQWILDYRPARNIWFRAFQEASEVYTFEAAHRLRFGPDRLSGRGLASARVRTVTVEGAPEGLGRSLLEAAGLEEGAASSPRRLSGAHRRVLRHLRERGFHSATVRVVTSTPEENEVDVRLKVDPGRPVEFIWTGDEISAQLIGRLMEEWDGRLPVAHLATELAAAAEHELAAGGFYLADVVPTVEEREADILVSFEVQRGEKGQRVDLLFDGNQSLTDGELAAELPPTTSPDFFSGLSQRGSGWRERLELRYASEGHLDAEIGLSRTEFDSAVGTLSVVVPVDERLLSSLKAVAIEGAVAIAERRVLEASGLVVGGPFRLVDYVAARGKIRDLYRQESYVGTRIEASLERAETEVVARFCIEEGVSTVVGAIEIVGNLRTKEQIVKRRLTFAVGDPMRPRDLEESRQRLYELGSFRSVEIKAEAMSTPAGQRVTADRQRVTIVVVERANAVLDYGLRYRSADVENLQPTLRTSLTQGFEAVLRPQLRQPLGRGDVLELSLFLKSDHQNYRLGYRMPYFFGLYLPTELYLEHVDEDLREIGLHDRVDAFTFLQRHSLNRYLRLIWSYRLQESLLSELVGVEPETQIEGVILDEPVLRSEISLALVGDSRDRFLNPSQGNFWSTSVQRSVKVLGSEVDSTRFYGQFSVFHNFGSEQSEWIWASSYRFGALDSDNFFLDLENRFTAGGPFSLRGFAPNGLSPLSLDGRPLGGEGVVIINQELRFPLWRSLRGGLFFDTGNVFLGPRDVDLSDLRQTVGVGLRYEIPFAVFRADYGWVIDRRPGESPGRFHFAFGHAF